MTRELGKGKLVVLPSFAAGNSRSLGQVLPENRRESRCWVSISTSRDSTLTGSDEWRKPRIELGHS